jgi:lysophospholipase L1-like esterase
MLMRMNRQPFAVLIASFCLIAPMAAMSIAPPAAPPTKPAAPEAPAKPSTIVPVPRADEWWQKRHAACVERAKKGHVDLLFIGDSITQGWEGEGKDVWATRYAPLNAMNIGFGGDRTQHVLWRLDNGEVTFGEGAAPKAAVIMIGTNNSNGADNTAEEIAAGIEAIVKSLRAKLPETKILLLAIFPRGEQPNPQREKNAKASALASQLADGKMVTFLDIGSKFVNADGSISKDIMPDYLHLSARGYEIWADAIDSQLKQIMGESAPAKP